MANNDLEKIAKAFSGSNTSTKKQPTKSTSTKKTSNSSNGKNYWGKNYYKNPDLNNKTTTTKTTSASNKKVNSSVNKALNSAIDIGVSNSTSSSTANTVVSKQIKKLPVISKICIILLFIIGVAVSIGICFFVCRNDQFEIIGKKNITLNVNDTYVDLGVNAVGFGFDMTDSVTIEVYKNEAKLENGLDGIDTSSDALYQIVYKLNNFRFRNAQIIRTINVITPVEEEPEESYTPDETITKPLPDYPSESDVIIETTTINI